MVTVYENETAQAFSEQTENIIAGITLVILGITGAALNVVIVIAFLRIPIFRSAFGYICISLLAGNTAALLIGTFWMAPVTLLELGWFAKTSGAAVERVTMVVWYSSNYCQLQIAVNRFIAIVFPLRYSTIFKLFNVKIIIGGSWILAILHASTYLATDCYLFFDTSTLTLGFWGDQCTTIVYYSDFLHGVIICAMVLVINSATFYFLQTSNKKRAAQSMHSANEHLENHNRNVRFYFQGCLTAAMLAIALIGFHLLPLYTRTRMETFLATTFTWLLGNTMDGIILIVLNKPVRDLIFRRNRDAPKPYSGTMMSAVILVKSVGEDRNKI